MTRKQYEKLMKKKGITRTELAIKLKCSLSSINFIMYGLTQKGKIKEAMDRFLIDKKLNVQKIREKLQEMNRPVSWLAREMGVSSQTLKHQLDNKTVKDADRIAKALGVKPVSIIIFEV